MDTILNYLHAAGNVLSHAFRTNVRFWAAFGLLAALLVLRGAAGNRKGGKRDSDCGMEGIGLGMCFGLLIGTALGDSTGMGLPLGMLIGLVIGMCIHRKPGKDGKQEG